MLGDVALGALLFVLAAALDFADAQHKLAVEQRDVHRTARWSVTMYLVGVIGAWSLITEGVWIVVPEAAGLYAGSVIAMRRARLQACSDAAVNDKVASR